MPVGILIALIVLLITSGVAIVLGVNLVFGLGWALIAGGVACLAYAVLIRQGLVG